jgi:hypothetical protein
MPTAQHKRSFCAGFFKKRLLPFLFCFALQQCVQPVI